MSKGRKPIELDKDEFRRCIEAVESNGALPNMASLWLAVENSTYAKTRIPRALTAATASAKAREFGIVTKTLPGRKGAAPGENRFSGGERPKRKPKAFDNEAYLRLKSYIPKEMRDGLDKVIRKAATGNLKASVRLKCLDCSSFQKREIKFCGATDCSLWLIRPYKSKPGQIPLEVVEDSLD